MASRSRRVWNHRPPFRGAVARSKRTNAGSPARTIRGKDSSPGTVSHRRLMPAAASLHSAADSRRWPRRNALVGMPPGVRLRGPRAIRETKPVRSNRFLPRLFLLLCSGGLKDGHPAAWGSWPKSRTKFVDTSSVADGGKISVVMSHVFHQTIFSFPQIPGPAPSGCFAANGPARCGWTPLPFRREKWSRALSDLRSNLGGELLADPPDALASAG